MLTHEELEIRPVPDEPGFYARVDGTVWTTWRGRGVGRRRKNWVLSEDYLPVTPTLNRATKYLTVKLWTKIYQVGTVILMTYVGPCPAGMECCHGPDHNPSNNCVDNLRWGTRASNMEDKNPNIRALTTEEKEEMKQEWENGVTMADLAILSGLSLAYVWKIIHS